LSIIENILAHKGFGDREILMIKWYAFITNGSYHNTRQFAYKVIRELPYKIILGGNWKKQPFPPKLFYKNGLPIWLIIARNQTFTNFLQVHYSFLCKQTISVSVFVS
jgi:hypothetical protein